MDDLNDLEIAEESENIEELNKLELLENSEENIPTDETDSSEIKQEITLNRESLFDEEERVDYDTLCAALDGLLLVYNKPMTYEKLSQVLGISVEATEQLVLERKKTYDDNPKSGLQIAILENGIELATKAKISHFIQKLDGQKLVSLSLPALETLSVIAFKQPITKAEIDAIRGVNSEGVISNLLEKKLIYISGEKKLAIGHPRLYSTTQDFLYYFGMNSLKELPVPTIDVNEALASEVQKQENINQQKEIEKDFNTSQGFMPIEDNNELGKISANENENNESSNEADILATETSIADLPPNAEVDPNKIGD